MLFKFQLDTSYLINECLNKNKICILTGNSGIGKKYIINSMECNYNKYPIIENSYTINDFFLQLMIFNDNLNTADISIGVGQNLQFSFSLIQMINKFSSFFKTNFQKAEEKIIKEIENLSKKNNLLLTIQLYKNTSQNLIDFICNNLTKLNIRIVLIIDIEDLSYLKLKSNFGKHEEVVIDCKKEDIYNEFEGLVSREDTDKIVNLTNGNIKSIIEIYNYLNNSTTNNPMPVYFPDIPPPNLTVRPDNRIWTLVCRALAPNHFSSANVSPSTRSPHPSTVPPSTLPMSDKITSRPIGSGIF